MKKLMLALALFCLIAAGAPPASLAGEMVRVGISMPTKALQRWNQDGANLKNFFEAKGYKTDLRYAEDDYELQRAHIEQMLEAGATVLVIAAVDGSTLGGALETASRCKAPVIAYDRLIMGSENVNYYVTFDNYKVGRMQAEYIVNALELDKPGMEGRPAQRLEIFAGSSDDNNSRFFFHGAMDVLKPYVDSSRLVIPSGQNKFMSTAIPGWSTTASELRMLDLMEKYYPGGSYPDAILAANDSIALGVIKALRERVEKAGDGRLYPVLTGQDCDIANVAAMLENLQSMSIFKDTRVLARETADLVSAVISGDKVKTSSGAVYNNGVFVVPTLLCDPVFADKHNYKELLVDSGYYKESELRAYKLSAAPANAGKQKSAPRP